MPVQAIPIELGGTSHQLRYDFRALAKLENEFGVPIGDIGQKLAGKLWLKDMTIFLWAGLIHENPAMTQAEAEELIAGEDMLFLATKMTEAMSAAFPTVNEKKKKEPKN